ncbi:MAG: family transcriptional regulator [Microbacteriaceae bacterium]|nr:family transcriptional regulator [Microbacteriaceae bacterium]
MYFASERRNDAYSASAPGANSRKLVPEDARVHNRALVLRILYREGEQSRADIARATGLAKITVGELVAELIDDKLVRELGTRGSGQRGKPPTVLAMDKSAFAIVGIDLSQPELFRGALLDLGGKILERAESPASTDTKGALAVDAVISLIDDLVSRSRVPIIGIGVGSPGIVDGAGIVRKATNLGWADLDLAGIVARRFGAAGYLVNDADAATLAERAWGGAGDDVIVIRVGRGVGAGAIIAGRLVRGSRFGAGEIGHVVVGTDGGEICTCGKTGCLETWLSVTTIRRQLEALPATDEAGAHAVHQAAGHRLGISLAPIVGLLDVSEIVLSGPADVLTEEMALAVQTTIAERTRTADDYDLSVRLSDLGEDGVLRGAAAQVLESQLGIV